MGNFERLKPFFREHWDKYVVGVLFILIVDFLQIISPKILGIFTEALKNKSVTMNQIKYYILLMIAIAFAIAVLKYLWRVNIMGTGRLLENYLSNSLFSHFQSLSLNFFNNHKTGDLMAHATNDILSVRTMFSDGIVNIIDFIVLAIASVIMMFTTINCKLALAALSPFLILLVLVLRFVKVIQVKFKESQEAFASMTDCVQENFSGIRVVKSFVQEEYEAQKFTAVNYHNMEKNTSVARMWAVAVPMVMYMASLSFVITVIYGGVMVINKEIMLGDFMAFNGYLGLLIWPMMALGWVIGLIQRGTASMERLNKLFDNKPEIFDAADVQNINEIKGDVEFRNLTFTYPGECQPVLKNINLHIRPGKTLAIVGRTGSGKTTLVNLILRLHNVPREQLFIDGYDINQIPLGVLRENIGYVPQDNFLFSTTIRENIDFFTNASEEEIEKAAGEASVYKDIMDFNDRFDTVLGERGLSLSGGQKQRIAIARALVRDPNILILDDSLSAVDTRTEEHILNNLREYIQGRSAIIVSHRISSVQHADEIIVLDEGEIVERGTHQQLVALNGIYNDMYQKQLLEEKIEDEE